MTSNLIQHGLVAVVVLASSQTAHAQWQSRFSRYPTYQPQGGTSCNCESDDARAAHSSPLGPYQYQPDQYQPVSYSANRWDARQWTPRDDYDRLRVSTMTDPYWSTPNRGWDHVAQAQSRNPISLGIETGDNSLKPATRCFSIRRSSIHRTTGSWSRRGTGIRGRSTSTVSPIENKEKNGGVDPIIDETSVGSMTTKNRSPRRPPPRWCFRQLEVPAVTNSVAGISTRGKIADKACHIMTFRRPQGRRCNTCLLGRDRQPRLAPPAVVGCVM